MTSLEHAPNAFRPASVGLIFAILTILFGQGLGVVFGLNEDAIKGRLKASAEAVRDTVYKGDAAAMKPVLDKSWAYMQRAHLHAGAMGTSALALITLLCLIGTPRIVLTISSIALGLGGLGYSLYWMWAGFKAPGLGSTGAAKESLKLLAMPSSAAFCLATLATCIILACFALRRPSHAAH